MMTKEELEKNAEEYLKKKNYTSGYIGYFASGYCKQAYVDSAEPREKRIAELEAQIEELKEELAKVCNLKGCRRIKELEAQIEKMKRYLDCEYCEHYTQFYGCKNCNEELRSDWSLKR